MIHLIVGNTGSGKTTYSYQLKKKHKAIIFSIDKWNKELYLADKKPQDGLDWFLERIDRSEVIILDLIEQLESCNVDSILDLGLSKLEHRNKFRAFALSQGFEIKTHFLDIPKEIRWSRVSNRNIEKGITYEFEVTKDNFEFMEGWFEAPNTIEMSNGILIKQ